MKSLYNEHNGFSEEALKLMREINIAISPILENWVAKGYNPREIAAIMADEADYRMQMLLLKQQVEHYKAQREAKQNGV